MTLLTPLGLLGLIGIIILIIIYIIKPNYQQKFVSTTFVWKLSLKYRKRKLPFNKLRNIILIICQVLLLTACAAILTNPNQILKSRITEPEVIVILDSSASMRAYNEEGLTRYERATEGISELVAETFNNDGFVSVIVADDQPEFLVKRAPAVERSAVEESVEKLVSGEIACSYATADLDYAIGMTEEIFKINPDAKVYLYTDNYESGDNPRVPKGVEIVSLRDDEKNGAVLSAKTLYEENYYTFLVDVACYGMDKRVEVCVDVYGANAIDSNDQGVQVNYRQVVECVGEETTKVIFVNESLYLENEDIYQLAYGDNVFVIPDGNRVYSYQSIHVSILEENGDPLEDSFLEDNTFDIYGGQKQVIKVQYASGKPNSFWPAILREIRNVYSDLWDIQLTFVQQNTEPAINGFDLYVFEHEMPEKMPDDGVLFLVNPDKLPANMDVRLGGMYQVSNPLGGPLEEFEKHPLLNHVEAPNITVSMFTQMVLGGDYEALMGMGQFPLLAYRNDDDCKTVILPFSLHYSNLPVILEFPMLVYNTFELFFPPTIEKNAFAVNETVTLNARGNSLSITGYEYAETLESFPAQIKVQIPGTYTVKQTVYSGMQVTEKFYVNIPNQESNLHFEGEVLPDLYSIDNTEEYLRDLLLILAIALTALVFVEWFIRSHESW